MDVTIEQVEQVLAPMEDLTDDQVFEILARLSEMGVRNTETQSNP